MTPALHSDSLLAKIQARLAHIVRHPASIEIRESDGQVILDGVVLDRELNSVLSTVRGTPGVRSVDPRLEVVSTKEPLQPPAHPENHLEYESGFVVGQWTPAIRVIAGAAGSALLANSFRKRGVSAMLSSAIGAALVSRAVTNRDLAQLIGTLIMPTLRLRRSIHVAAPIDIAYEFCRDFSNYPKFMSFIRDVSVSDMGTLSWTATAPGGTPIHWQTTVFGLQMNQKIAWKSVPGSLIATEGIIQLKPTDFGTQIQIQLSYAPPVGALGYIAAHFLGFDPRSRIDTDLEVLKRLIERQGRELRAQQKPSGKFRA